MRRFDRGRAEIVTIDDTTFSRATYEPGWRWSECVKPLVQTDSCQLKHQTFILSGRLGVTLNDGSETEIGPGEAVVIPPGHDGWVIGNEPCMTIDFMEAAKG